MSTPLYQRLAASLEKMILRRSFRPGDKIPSVRRFSQEQRVSVPTALSAYAALEARGLIEARPKSGFYVCARQTGLIPEVLRSQSASKISDLAHADPLDLLMADQYHPGKVQLGSAVPSPDLLPGVRLARALSAVARRYGAQGGSYGPQEGSLNLRREIARRSLAAGFTVGGPEEVLLTSGGTEAILLALRATCMPGDTVVVETPTFFGLLRQLRDCGLKALPIPVHPTEGICLGTLARALARTRVKALLLVPNFHNPMGFVMPDANKRELVRLASSHGIPIIEDDVYGDLQHRGPRPHTLKAREVDGNVLYCSSFSKNIAPGYRVGYIIAGKWQGRVAALKRSQTGPNANLPAEAIAEFIKNGGYDRYMRSFRESLRQQVGLMSEAVAHSFPEGIRLSRPEGGYILWCELPAQVDSLGLVRQASAAGITVAPGPLFSTDGGYRNFLRINCGVRWGPAIERAVGVLGHLVRGAA